MCFLNPVFNTYAQFASDELMRTKNWGLKASFVYLLYIYIYEQQQCMHLNKCVFQKLSSG